MSDLATDFTGRRGPLFRMALVTGTLTVLTLGIYRFWMKTRLRRYYWSAVRPGGHPLEYVGEPLEKLLGFFIAVVILAFYIGIVNLLLMFVSFSLFDGNAAAYIAFVAGVVPVWFYASYRARRYVYARTRWRGIRFGVDPGAWGYAWRSMLYWALAIGSGTLLWPLLSHRLEKYKWDRTWFGDLPISQGGTARMLVRGAVPGWIVLGFAAIASVGASLTEDLESLVVTLLSAGPLILLAMAFYSVRSFRMLTETKTAGNVRFRSRARTPRVVGIYLLGYGLTTLLTILVAGMLGIAIGALAAAGAGHEMSLDALDEIDALAGPGLAAQAIGVAVYFVIFIVWTAFRHVFVTLPLWRHYAETLEVLGAESLHSVHQRGRDEHREAEGFAEALDLGAAI